jgi:cobaltochelatase CobS
MEIAMNKTIKESFGFEYEIESPILSAGKEYVPEIDPNYCFNQEATLAILAGFKYNRRVLIHGYHGTGKSTHIEQVAARLNWPCIRINFDGHITRMDLVGRDVITIREGLQVTEFQEGILPWAMQRPMAIVFDEYDAARAEVMFVLQRLLETDGRLTLLEKNAIIKPHEHFRIFATANTIGLGDNASLYHGTQHINQGQIDRWNIFVKLDYLPPEQEEEMLLAKLSSYRDRPQLMKSMVQIANLTRAGFIAGDLSTIMSPRTVLNWGENNIIFNDLVLSFKFSFLNKCDEDEKPIVREYYQRVFGVDI